MIGLLEAQAGGDANPLIVGSQKELGVDYELETNLVVDGLPS